MFKFIFPFFFCCMCFGDNLFAQDTLPQISVTERAGKILISWVNTYGATISNINIQRSTDSIKRFTTIGTVLNPSNRENGFVDTKITAVPVFYRVFVAFEGGSYVFTKSYRPVLDTSSNAEVLTVTEPAETVKPVAPGGFVPSKFVYTGRDNNVIISLADAANHKFSIHFFDDNDKPLFVLRQIKESYLILDKVNFVKSGWFRYHLYNNDILLEKFKFFIPRDGKNGVTVKELRHR